MLKEISKKVMGNGNTEESAKEFHGPTIMPLADIFEEQDQFILKAEMPGVKKENLEITIDEGNLIIEGKVEEDKVNYKYREYKLGQYYRSFKVGHSIDRDKIKAELSSGVLTLTLPKAEKLKPKKIEISAN